MASKLKLTELLYPTSTTAAITINSDDSVTIPTQSTTNLAYTGTLTGGTGVVNLGSGQFYKTAGGNVGIGTTTPDNALTIQDSGAGVNKRFSIRNGDSTNSHKLTMGYNAGALSGFIPATSVFITGETNGGFGILTALSIGTISATPIIFGTSNTENMRIDASGNLLVGTQSAALSGYSGVLATSNAAGVGTALNASRNDVASNSAAGCLTVYSNFSTTQEKFIVRANGDVQNRTGSYTAYSDERLKENIVDARSYTEDLCKLRVVNYQFKADTIKTKYLGFVAQEVEQVIPGLVFETETDGLKDCKGVKLSIMIPMLVKAIQEQQALITQLQADVATLKGAA